MKISLKLTTLLLAIFMMQSLNAFDHQHAQWNLILQQNVHFISNGLSSRVDYNNIKKNSTALKNYLSALSAVSKKEFNQWSQDKQKAFLINAYNAFTIQLVVTQYPDLHSIKDIGSFFSTPWKKEFFSLLGKQTSLNDIEHKILRKQGIYDDPYIHVALVCASISCPALRNEAYTAAKIELQLEDAIKKFLSDKDRNRYNPETQSLEVSKIFDWYESDFSKGYRGLFLLSDLFSRFSKELTNNEKEQEKIQSRLIQINYLDYDWRLNDWLSDKTDNQR